jgi:hypothetical protein
VPAPSSPSQSALRASGFTLGLLKACFLLFDVARRPFTGDSGDRGVEPAPTWAAMPAYSIAASSGAATSIVNVLLFNVGALKTHFTTYSTPSFASVLACSGSVERERALALADDQRPVISLRRREA